MCIINIFLAQPEDWNIVWKENIRGFVAGIPWMMSNAHVIRVGNNTVHCVCVIENNLQFWRENIWQAKAVLIISNTCGDCSNAEITNKNLAGWWTTIPCKCILHSIAYYLLKKMTINHVKISACCWEPTDCSGLFLLILLWLLAI